ncbi:Eco57I restriction-modification methylase domain-containing protein [Nocardia pseudovaccinii]|uniref:Eco57I restriction-modification methylase domain-containing protein n=1 Tax=Nocardia pseudovaccinii TaxID=189540 RepID=UPI0007A544AD|nr:methyltransferase domain-containing protein [Nocardia pseudovaccinii]
MTPGEPAARDRKRHGRHYTPPALARFLAQRLLAHAPPPLDVGTSGAAHVVAPDVRAAVPGPHQQARRAALSGAGTSDGEVRDTTALGAGVSAPSAGVLRVLDPACGDGELLLALDQVARELVPGVRVELVGYDLDAAGVAVARERAAAAGVAIEWHIGDFLTESAGIAAGSFDAIITNPPYVRTQQLGGPTAQLLSKQFGLQGRIDLTHPFVAVAPRLLRSGGVLGLLCANRFLTTKAGANIRSLLRTELAPVELYDLGDTKLFEAAVLPAVTIATRTAARAVCRYVSAYEVDAAEIVGGTDLFEALAAEHSHCVEHCGRTFAVEVGTLATGDQAVIRWASGDGKTGDRANRSDPVVSGPVVAWRVADSGRGDDVDAAESVARDADGNSGAWRMSRPEVDRWLAEVEAGTWRTFGAVGRIRVGIKTTADRVFISDRWAQVRPRPEGELLFDLITHQDVDPWRISRARDVQVLYPYDPAQPARMPVDLREFPRAAAYLESHRETLAGRKYLTDSGRQWFEIWVPQRPHLWRVPKVVFPDISERPRFALDRSGAVVNGDCYWISLADLGVDGAAERLAYLLMGVANSALGLRFYDAVCGNRLYSGRRRWITQYVSRLPLPDPTTMRAGGVVELVREFVDDGREPDANSLRLLDEWVAAAFGTRMFEMR